MNIQNVYILEDRGILFVNGADTKEFLQNLISNDINKVNETNSCFASLLTPQGKFLYAFINPGIPSLVPPKYLITTIKQFVKSFDLI